VLKYKTVKNVFHDANTQGGHWSRVDLVVDEHGSEFAVKEVGGVEPEHVPLFWHEVDVLFNLLPSHHNICPVLGWFEKSENHFGFVMPYIRNRTLSILDLEKDCAKWYTEQALSTLAVFHAHKLIFCNIKPENILVKEHTDEICFIDFDCLTHDDGEKHLALGSGIYEAPEQGTGYYSVKADSYSMGIIIAGMAMGDINFWNNFYVYVSHHNINKYTVIDEFRQDLMKGKQYEGRSFWQKYKAQYYSSPPPLPDLHPHHQHPPKDFWVAELEDLVAQLTHYDPAQRLSCTDALKHPYFTTNPTVDLP